MLVKESLIDIGRDIWERAQQRERSLDLRITGLAWLSLLNTALLVYLLLR